VLNSGVTDPARAYLRAALGLRLKILAKILKSPFLYNPLLRRLIMSSGLGSIETP
jgi:hypothetical protein